MPGLLARTIFCLGVFISPLLLKDNFAYLDFQIDFFSCNTLNFSLFFLLTFMISDWKLIIIYVNSLQIRYCGIFLAVFKISLFTVTSYSWNIYVYALLLFFSFFLHFFSALYFQSSLHLQFNVCHSFWNILHHYYSKKFFCSALSNLILVKSVTFLFYSSWKFCSSFPLYFFLFAFHLVKFPLILKLTEFFSSTVLILVISLLTAFFMRLQCF